LAQIRSSRRYDYAYQAVEAGTAATSWYASDAGKRVLIAAGSVHVGAPGAVKLTLHLTAAGRAVLKSSKYVHVSALAEFKPRAHQGTQRAQASFTLS
jgi:hypothetical protein